MTWVLYTLFVIFICIECWYFEALAPPLFKRRTVWTLFFTTIAPGLVIIFLFPTSIPIVAVIAVVMSQVYIYTMSTILAGNYID